MFAITGRDLEGLLDYRTAFRINPTLAARALVGILADQLKQNAAALFADCEKHLQKYPRDAMTYGRRGLVLLLQGKDAEADKRFLAKVSPVESPGTA